MVTLMLVGLSAGLYAFQNPKGATYVPASSVDPAAAFVMGVVRDEISGTFIPGVRVAASDSFATTNTNGEFTIPLVSGNYELLITKEGYEQQSSSVNLLNAKSKTISISMKKK